MRPSALIFKIHGCHATSTSQQDARLPGGDSSYRGQKVQGHKLCLMVYFSDAISAKMTKISFLAYKGCLFFQQKYLKYVSRHA